MTTTGTTVAGRGAGRLRILVLGYIVRGPLGGLAWHHLQYVLGLARLGHDVYFLEDSGDHPSCYDPATDATGPAPEYGLRFAARAFARLGVGERWAYHDAHESRWLGPCASRVPDLCSSADLLLNVSGVNPLRPWLSEVPARALIDTDPVFTQIRHLVEPEARDLAARHTAFFSYGENLARGQSAAPQDGLPWRPTRQPIVLDAWPVTPGPRSGKFSTVMQWDSYPPQEYAGQHYGMKSHSFGPFLDLPRRAGPVLELAVGSASAPRGLLREKGWSLADPLEITHSPWTYQRYIRGSKAEFAVAKQGYVSARCGWFSERSAAYLASGRPVVVQDTGFGAWLEADAGVIGFTTADEALAGIEEVSGRYELHCRAARELAAEHFDARAVLGRLIEEALAPAAVAPAALPERAGATG